MGIYVDGMITPQHACQLGCYPFREGDRDPCADADYLHMRNLSQGREDAFKLVIFEEEWIASGEDDITDRGIGADIPDCFGK